MSAQFNAFVLDLPGDARTATARRMFGGVGYHADGLFFAIAGEDVLYFRVDGNSRSYFEAESMDAFAARGPGTKSMHDVTLPGRLYDDTEQLKAWLTRALEAARTGAGKGRKRPI